MENWYFIELDLIILFFPTVYLNLLIVSLNNTLHTSLYKETITSIIPSNTLLVYRVFIVVAIAILAITLILLVIYRHRFR